MNRFRRVATLVVATTLLAAPAQVAHAGSGAAALTGVVTLDGEPVSGAVVTVSALPTLGTDVASQYRESPLAMGRTNGTGHFAIEVTVSRNVAEAAQAFNADHVNLWLQAFYNAVDEAHDDVGNVTVTPDVLWSDVGTAYTAADLAYVTVAQTGATSLVGEATATVMSVPEPATLELKAVEASRQAQMTGPALAEGFVGPVPCAAGDDVVGPVPCTPDDDEEPCRSMYAPLVTVERREISYQPVGELHAMYDTTGEFEYGEHANTDLNGAFKQEGGSWSATLNANHVGNKSALITKDYASRQAYVLLTGFRYRLERLDFTDDRGDGRVCRSDYRVLPDGWVGGYMFGADVSGHDSAGQLDTARAKGWAVIYKGKGDFWKHTAKGEKYTAGVNAFGVGLFAVSEWSNQVDFTLHFGNDGDHWIYGSNADPVEAKSVYEW